MNHNVDQLARERALNPKQSFIVQAPAGSGKTGLLVKRFLKLLLGVNAPEEVVAITFTQKAAKEMLHRVLEALDWAQQGIAPQSAHELELFQLATCVLKQSCERGWHLIENPTRFRILTIDALCAQLVSSLPILSTVGTVPAISDQPDFLYDLAIDSLLEAKVKEQQTQTIDRVLLHLDNHWLLLRQLLKQLLQTREQWLAIVVAGHLEPEAMRQALTSTLERHRAQLLHKVEAHAKQQPELCQTLQQLSSWLEINGWDGVFDQQSADYNEVMSFWYAWGQVLFTSQWKVRKRLDKRQGFHVPAKQDPQYEVAKAHKLKAHQLLESLNDHPQWVEVWMHFMQFPHALLDQDELGLMDALVDLLPQLVVHLRWVFSKGRCCDFNEIAINAVGALGSPDQPTDLALSLDYQIHHLLVDEFQDTSYLQYQLIQALTLQWSDYPGQKTLFLVGDPMQSIYRFRQAEVGLFLQVKEQGLGELSLEFLQLTRNFRSSAGLVTHWNQLFPQVFPKEDNAFYSAISYAQSHVGRETSFKSDDCLKYYVYADGHQQATAIAKEIQSRLCQYPDQTIAVLVRSRAHLPLLLDCFDQHDIPYSGKDLAPLIGHGVIQDLCALTKAMCYWADQVSWLAVLRAPWCGLVLSDLAILTHHAQSTVLWEVVQDPSVTAQLSEQGQIRLQRMVAIFKILFDKRPHSLALWVQQAWTLIGGIHFVASDDRAVVEQYFEIMTELNLSVVSFDRKRLEEKLEKTYAYSQNMGPVVVMTIHKAKGLEFDHVILADVARSPRASSHALLAQMSFVGLQGQLETMMAPYPQHKQGTGLYAYIRRVDNQKTLHESLRLLYVAMTRAKQTLSLYAVLPEDEQGHIKSPPHRSLLGLIWPVIEHEVVLQPNHPTAVMQEDTRHFLSRYDDSALSKLPHTDTQVLRSQQNSVDLSSVETYFWRSLGQVIHQGLAVLASSPSCQDAKESVMGVMKGCQMSLEQLGFCTSQVSDGVALAKQAFLKMLNDPVGQNILFPQADFSACEYRVSGYAYGQFKHWVIDRIWTCQDQVWIIDYKTVYLDNTEDVVLLIEQKMQQYADQLNTYAKLIEQLWPDKTIHIGLYLPLQGLYEARPYKTLSEDKHPQLQLL